MYNDRHIPDEVIWEILENANWAPNHRKTEPWRFRVLRDKALERLGEYLANTYKETTPDELFSEFKYEKMRKKALSASCVLIISMQRDSEERVPEWEELAAVACAVQNIWLSCTAFGIGAYWSTPSAIVQPNDFLPMRDWEQCLGMLYMGQWEQQELPAQRGSIRDKVQWVTD